MKGNLPPGFQSWGALFLLAGAGSAVADWPQWRGPHRNGVSEDGKLPGRWGDDFTPVKLWESEEVPSDHYGGHGSAVIADGRVYLSVVWHRDEPTPTRTLTSRTLSKLGFRGNNLGDELMAELEEARRSLSPRLRGSRLREWTETWAEERLTAEQLMRYKGWIRQRFQQGKTAIPWTDLKLLKSIQGREFENMDAFREWVGAQTFEGDDTAERVLAAVPNTKMAANDVILCLDLSTGETLWKYEVAGHPAGRTASSTPAVAGGRVYGLLSEALVAVDAATGEERWRQSIDVKRGLACSPMVRDGRVIVYTGRLRAFDAATGETLWQNDEAGGSHSSPAGWKDLVLMNGRRDFLGVDLETGETRWRQPGGGDATPVAHGDHCVLVSKADERNLAGYRLSIEGAQLLWKHDFMARRYGSSPVIRDGYLYHLGSARHLCVELETGAKKWETDRTSNLSSPIVVGDKLLVFENNGGFLAMIGATPQEHEILGRVKVGALGSSSPALDGSRLVVRQGDRVVCYDLMQSQVEG